LSKGEVAQQVREARRSVEHGTPVPDLRITVSKLIELFLTKGLSPQLSPKTVEAHTGVLKLVSARIGGIRLAVLVPSDIGTLCRDMLAEGYSTSYASRVRSLMSQVLGFAEAEGLVMRNVARLAPAVNYSPTERDHITTEEAQQFIEAARSDRMSAAIIVMMTLGLRPGEAMGLAWKHVDLDDGVLHVRQSLKHHPDPATGKPVLLIGPVKTKRSVRSLRLPAVTLVELRRHRAAQAVERAGAGEGWSNHEDLCFTTKAGTPIDPANLRRAVRQVAKAAGITKAVNPYDFRRTMVSLLSAADISGERIADVAGNDAKTALSIYRHRMDPIVEDAVATMDELFGAG
jgi:integrase